MAIRDDKAAMAPAKPKQAVVFIHGIGEQRPMETLRRFVQRCFPAARITANPARSPIRTSCGGSSSVAGRRTRGTPSGTLLPSKTRTHGRWIVTDLVTMGSPLAYAPILLAEGVDEFEAKKHMRELPTP